MKIEYELIESDLIALAQFQIDTSLVLRRRIRRLQIGYVVGFALLALGTYLTLPSAVPLVAYAILAALALVVYPVFIRWRIRRSAGRLVRERLGTTSLGKRQLSASTDGLEQLSEKTQWKASWPIVGEPTVTSTHIFVPIDGIYSVIIPKDPIPALELEAFLEAFRRHKIAAA